MKSQVKLINVIVIAAIIGAVLGLIREVFLKEYEEQYGFGLSVFSGIITAMTTFYITGFFRK